MSEIISFANQKGGVGKTTSCVNIAASLVAAKKRVLLIDLDPQGNATMGSGVDKNSLEVTVNDVLQENTKKVAAAIIENTPAGYDLLPSNGDLTAAEVYLLKKREKEKKLFNILAQVVQEYDYILLDCPPSLNMITVNALTAATGVVVPMQCEYYALEGLTALLETIKQIKSTLNPGLNITGIIRTMYDPRNRLAKDVSAELVSHFKSKVYKTVIPRNVRLAEAPSHGVPVLLYDKSSSGSRAYMKLAKEIISRSKIKPSKKAGGNIRKTRKTEAETEAEYI